jgi:hypothetical protein
VRAGAHTLTPCSHSNPQIWKEVLTAIEDFLMHDRYPLGNVSQSTGEA